MSGDSTRRKMDVEGLRLELPDGGNGNACWSTPKMFVPKSPYNLDGLLADSAKRTVGRRTLFCGCVWWCACLLVQ